MLMADAKAGMIGVKKKLPFGGFYQICVWQLVADGKEGVFGG